MMDYEQADRDAVQYLVSCVVKGTRFYLTGEKLATDLQSRAASYSLKQAEEVAAAEVSNTASWGERSLFRWKMVRRTPNARILD